MKKIILLLLLFFFTPLTGEGTTWTKIEFEIESLQVPARAAAIGEDLDKEYRLGVRSVIEIIENGSLIHRKEFSRINSDRPNRRPRGGISGIIAGQSAVMVIEKIDGRTYFPRLKAFANGLEDLESIIDDSGDDPQNYMEENIPTVNCETTGLGYGIQLSDTSSSCSSAIGCSYNSLLARCPNEEDLTGRFHNRSWISIGNNHYLTWDFPQF